MIEIKLNTLGKVIDGEYPNWYIGIDSNCKSGYLIYLIENINSPNSKAYDDWVEDYTQLEIYFSDDADTKWKIEWLDINLSDILY